ncbi:MAG TPA: malto-oligosyltrehalose synthase [Casimicrobiaceae bacterium]|nr:malto-oligosyltrehalose synthase [Casimicrobiaceae bacterium]
MSALSRLAELHGIALEYHDVWGKLHDVAETTLRALLAAMDVAAATDFEVESSLAAGIAAQWREIVAPAVVVRERSHPKLRVHLHSRWDAAPLQWRLTEEQGAERRGNLDPADFDVAERTTLEGVELTARELLLPVLPPLGYHSLALQSDGAVIAETLLIVVPAACFSPPALANGGRVWGAAAQLYGVRSERNWGIGDFTDLATLTGLWATKGADVLGVNPLHALFPHDPAHASPYSPSSRLFLNILYLDVEAIADFVECEDARALVASAELQAALARLRAAELVDYPGVASIKLRVVELLYAHFRAKHLIAGSGRAHSFRGFCARGGEALRLHALFEAIQEHFFAENVAIRGWPAWPESYRDPGSPVVERFATEHAERVEYYEYLQWQADLQLGAVRAQVVANRLGVGLYVDLAVSIDRAGAEAWTHRRVLALGASVGAPPDEFNMRGQNWGLPPLIPERLRSAAYRPFIDTLRANMRHAGALRVDHVMGLMRLFWIPDGKDAGAGAYVRYPFADLLGILALESQRHRCLVIGEDLGTVPEEVRTALSSAGVLSYRLLYFERDADEFKLPSTYPAQALVAASTHDLPTLAGWWYGRDIALRDELGLFPSTAARDQQLDARKKDRAELLLALRRESLLPSDVSPDAGSTPPMTAALARAVQAFLARTPSQVLVVQLEDVLGVSEQANLPATVDTHPNWRRKLALALEHWPGDGRFVELTETLRRSRPHRPAAGRAVDNPPRATYRLQLHREFTFADATRLVPYLAALGVSHVYCSPYLRARAGSRHGYDIVDHAALNPEIGDRAAFDRFAQALLDHAMGQIVDVVPNHMAVMGADNVWWMDVLENGQASIYADYFDIDWHPPDPDLAGKVLVPVLGDHYGRVLEKGELQLRYETGTGAFAVRYHEHRLPIDPRDYSILLDLALTGSAQLANPLPESAMSALASIATAFRRLPARHDLNPAHLAERNRDKELNKRRLTALLREHSALADSIEQAVGTVNGTPGDPASFATLHGLLEAQAYRVAFWRVVSDEINYRRFFDINDLAALRVENEAVFEATHRFVLDLAAEGKAHGFRIDHPDGLYDPAAYFERLQGRYAALTVPDGEDRRGGNDRTPLYLVVEKIDAPHERLPERWPIHGTTGYRFANLLNGVFVDSAARARIDRAWRAFVGGEASDFGHAAHDGKRRVMQTSLTAELSVLANRLRRIARADRGTRDLTLSTLSQALLEIAACFPVYRTYVAATISAQDRRYIDWALAVARKKGRNADASVFDFIRDVLLVRPPDGAVQATEDAYRTFAMRFQQFSAPVTAKGVEDTSFYTFNRLVSLNEVGGDPDRFGTSVRAFHRANAERLAHWPDTMLAGSTHDNKRSADVRARIDVVSEMPAAWRLRVRRWSRINRTRKHTVDDLPAPSRNDEYLLYQTLVGTLPAEALDAAGLARYRARIEQYVVKAAREAKLHTSWLAVNEEYESALKAFVSALLDGAASNHFLADLRSVVPAFEWFGALNSVAMALVHFTAPGVPDIYQGNEIIDLSLVDPDNRRAVDYALRAAMLGELDAIASGTQESLAARVHALLATPHDGRLKMWVISRALSLRREYPQLFARGDYVPINVTGERARHALAYARRQGNSGIVAVAGRLFASLGLEQGVAPVGEDAWGNATLGLDFLPPATQLFDVLTGAAYQASADGLALARVFATIPVALLRYETPA